VKLLRHDPTEHGRKELTVVREDALRKRQITVHV
jgi:hypothetical protein